MLGNIIADNNKARDDMISTELVEQLIMILNAGTVTLDLLRIICWTISSMCKGMPEPPLSRTQLFIGPLARVLQLQDSQPVADALWALSYITNTGEEAIELVVKQADIGTVVARAKSEDLSVKAAAFRVIGNICSGRQEFVDAIIKNGGLDAILHTMSAAENPQFVKEACWTLSNIVAGPPEHIEKVIKSGCFRMVAAILVAHKHDRIVCREAAWAIANASCNASYEQMLEMLHEDALEALCQAISIPDPEVQLIVMNALDRLMFQGAEQTGDNKIAEKIEELGGRDALHSLRMNANPDVCEKAEKILNEYYDTSEGSNGSDKSEEEDLEKRREITAAHAGVKEPPANEAEDENKMSDSQ